MYEWLLELKFSDNVRYNHYKREETARDAMAYHEDKGLACEINLYRLVDHLKRRED